MCAGFTTTHTTQSYLSLYELVIQDKYVKLGLSDVLDTSLYRLQSVIRCYLDHCLALQYE